MHLMIKRFSSAQCKGCNDDGRH